MKVVRLHAPVGIEGLTYEEAPDPAPAVGDVLVKVHAAGITPTELDWPIWTDPLGHKREYIHPGPGPDADRNRLPRARLG
jgi:NADPH:quinone reductase-like Zn-dependent oxidoreductase